MRNGCVLASGKRVLGLAGLEMLGVGSEAKVNTRARSAFSVD